MLLRFLFIIIASCQFLNTARSQETIINEFEGIIIYYDTDSIPQDVFLLPCKIEYKGSFIDFAVNTFKNYKGELIEIYFQGMRWGMPNLLPVVQQMNYLKCKRITMNGSFFKMRISAGVIFTDATFAKENKNSMENKEKFILEFETNRFNFISFDYNLDKNGLPVSFEPLYLK
jgi:hypothetical protein